MKKIILILLVALFLFSYCDNFNEKTKETISKTGETIGKTSSTFVDGVKEGIHKTFACEIILSQELQNSGLKTGKYRIESDADGKDNKLILYVIFDTDFNKMVQAKVLDAGGAEYGRAKANIKGKKGEAFFVDFIFDKRTNIEGQSKITLD
ncbi:MAG: hypothetical protein H7296_11280 [Bacteroidia bacterium]|nr:hypothetical protein [Bacteroidia bacterium]